MDENTLDVLGESPLLHFVRTIRKLYKEESAEVANDDGERKNNGLTAAVAFLHSRGMFIYTRTKVL
jgi:endothelin-converting enzyme